MQTIKGLIALALAAAVVFAVVVFYNHKTEVKYIAQLKNTIVAEPIKMAKQTTVKTVADAVHDVKAGEPANRTAAKAGGVKTNAVARQKVKNANL
jgi:hypothetical protein